MQDTSTAAGPEPVQPSTDSIVALSVENVQKSFGKQTALCGASFSVVQGQRVALLGPNGAGKTTLVRSICGRLKIDRGQILMFGQPIGEAGVLDRLGVVPQELAIYGDLTARENLQIFGRLHGIRGSELKDRVAWALEWVGLSDRGNHLTKTFSGGMKRRVNIACGVLHSPGLLLLDEPTVGVDPQSRQRIFDMLDELIEFGTTVVLTTHHLDEAQSRCDRIVIVDHGRVIADGTLEELIEETIGDQKHLELLIDSMQSDAIDGLIYDSVSSSYRTTIRSTQHELPMLLRQIADCGGELLDMHMHRSDLHQVFLHLTGRELRE